MNNIKKCARCGKDFKPCNCGNNRFFNYRTVYCSKECFKYDYLEDNLKIEKMEDKL